MSDMLKKTPWHLWLVGVVALLWNGFGAYDFTRTALQGEAYLRASGMSQAMIDYYAATPAWVYAPWGVGVWGGVLGSLLLLMRKKLASPVYLLSFLGAVGSVTYGMINTTPEMAAEAGPMKYLGGFIIAFALFLAWYAWRQKKAGVLR